PLGGRALVSLPLAPLRARPGLGAAAAGAARAQGAPLRPGRARLGPSSREGHRRHARPSVDERRRRVRKNHDRGQPGRRVDCLQEHAPPRVIVETSLHWRELLKHPAQDHLVQVYREREFLAEAVTYFVRDGLHQGEGALIIARPEHRRLFAARLGANAAVHVRDAEQTLAAFMVDGMPEWSAFHRVCGGAIRNLRLQSTGMRAYGEMVDILWQRGERKAALRLEDFWNGLRREQPFSLLCAYAIDPLEPRAYGGALESV